MTNKTLILLIDACRYNYVESMPFLSSLAEKNSMGRLKPVFGYNSILTSFITGVYPIKHGQLNAYSYDQTKDKVGSDKVLGFLPRFIAPYYFNLKRYLQGNDFVCPFIPFSFSKNFTVSQNKFYHHENVYPVKTLFNIFDREKIKFLFYQWPFIYSNQKTELIPCLKNNDKYRTEKFFDLIKKRKCDLYMLHLWDLDKYGHLLGPTSQLLNEKIKEQDNLIKMIFEKFSWEKNNILIWSDHGMLEVIKTINIADKLPVSDRYFYFLDSTMARFWFKDNQIKNQVMSKLNNLFGHFLSAEEKQQLKINFPHNKYGQEIFLADSGVLILPNFFQQKPVKGMHGYNLSDKNEWGIFLSNYFFQPEAEVIDLFPSILKVLNIKK